jgi:hypothetical protein
MKDLEQLKSKQHKKRRYAGFIGDTELGEII